MCKPIGMRTKDGAELSEGDKVRVCLDPEVVEGTITWDPAYAGYVISVGKYRVVTFLDLLVAQNKVGNRVWVEKL